MHKVIGRLITILTLSWSATTMAAVVEYTDFSAWDNATNVPNGALTNINWEGYIVGSNNVGGWDGTDGINDDVTFTREFDGNPPTIFGPGFIGANGSLTLGTGNVIAAGQEGIRIDLPASSFGVALDLRGYNFASSTFQITLDTGEIFSKTVSNPLGGFFGVVSDGTISSIVFDPVGTDVIIMDNVWVATVPAPGGLIVLVGLIGLALKRTKV